MVVWHEVDAKPHIGIRIATTQYKASGIRQLVQASSRAGANLALEMLGAFPSKAFRLHQFMNLICREAAEV